MVFHLHLRNLQLAKILIVFKEHVKVQNLFGVRIVEVIVELFKTCILILLLKDKLI